MILPRGSSLLNFEEGGILHMVRRRTPHAKGPTTVSAGSAQGTGDSKEQKEFKMCGSNRT